MKDGYYLSTYIYIDKLHYLLDITLPARHDQSISLWEKKGKDIRLVHYWELERITRLKQHHQAFYNKAHAEEFIKELLKQYNLTLDDIVEIWGTPFISTGNNYHSINDYNNISYHAVAHLFTSIFWNSKYFYNDNIISFALDGGPDMVLDPKSIDKEYYAGCIVQKGIMKIFPAFSPGSFWTKAKKALGLNEGSLMALGSASESKLINYPVKLVKVYNFRHIKNAQLWLNKLISDVDDALNNVDSQYKINCLDKKFSEKENRISIIVKEIQKISMLLIEDQVKSIINNFNVSPEDFYFSISGGFGLNCPTNSYIMKKFNFKGFLGPPCINDSGLSLGIALYSFYKNSNEKLKVNIKNSFYGNSDNSLEKSLLKYNSFIDRYSPLDLTTIVNDIINKPIAWYNGRSEIGPRALGGRSILANPGSESAKNELNRIKKREWWRPVAPVILEEHKDSLFECNMKSPYMLRTYHIKKEYLNKIPAIVHLDGSARVQTVSESDNELLYNVISAFYQETGIPALCNTSLNDKGEPIIDSISEVFNFCLRKKIEICYINGVRILLKNHENFNEKSYRKKPLKINISETKKNKEIKKLNPYGVSDDIIGFYKAFFPCILENYSFTKKDDVEYLLSFYKKCYDNKLQQE